MAIPVKVPSSKESLGKFNVLLARAEDMSERRGMTRKRAANFHCSPLKSTISLSPLFLECDVSRLY